VARARATVSSHFAVCQTQHQVMSLLDDDVGGGPCHIDRSPAGLVSSRPLAPQGRSVLSDFVSPISAIPPRGATQVESQRYSFGYPPGRCPGLVKCYRGRHGRDAIRIEHHHGRTRGFRFPFSFLRRERGSASVEPVRIWPSFTWSTATAQPSYQSLPSHTVSPRRSLRDLDTVANSAAWLGVPTERLQLFALEAWGVDDDGGTDAPTHLQVTPLKGHSTNTFSVDAILLSTRHLFGSQLLTRSRLGDEDREPQIFSGMFWHRGSVLGQFFFL